MTKNKLGKNALLNLIYNVVSMVFPLIVASYISRVLLPDGVGFVAKITNFASYFVAFAPMGIATYGIKVIAQSQNSDERNLVFSEMFVLNSISTFIMVVIYYSVIMIVPGFREGRVLYALAGMSIISNFFNVEWLYRGIENYSYITIRNFLIKIISTVATLGLVRDKEDIGIYLFITCGVSACNHLFNIVHARKYIRFSFSLNRKRLAGYLRPLFVILISGIAGEIYLKMDISMLGILSDNANVGYYSYALRLINIVLVAITSVTAVSLPQLSQRYNDNDKSVFNQQVEKLLKVILILSVPACVGISFVSKDIVVILFGKDFLASYSLLIILSFLFVIKGAGDLLCYQVVIATGSERILPGVRISSVILNFVLNYTLIKHYQHNGAALATVFTELFTLIIVVWLIRDKIRVKIKNIGLKDLLVATPIMVAGIYIVQRFVSDTFWRLFASIIVGAALYFLALFICTKISRKGKNWRSNI